MANQPQPTSEDAFGRRVREERTARGWTQSFLAAALREYGVALHFSAIAKIEAREATAPRAIRLNEAAGFAAVFGIPLDKLLTFDNAFDRARDEAQRLADPLLSALSRAERVVELVDDCARLPVEHSPERARDVDALSAALTEATALGQDVLTRMDAARAAVAALEPALSDDEQD